MGTLVRRPPAGDGEVLRAAGGERGRGSGAGSEEEAEAASPFPSQRRGVRRAGRRGRAAPGPAAAPARARSPRPAPAEPPRRVRSWASAGGFGSSPGAAGGAALPRCITGAQAAARARAAFSGSVSSAVHGPARTMIFLINSAMHILGDE